MELVNSSTNQNHHDEDKDSQSKNESEKSEPEIIGLDGKPLRNVDLDKGTIWQDSDGTPVLS